MIRTSSKYSELSTVESQRNELIPEEFPEGAYGMSLPTETIGKSGPWREDQRRTSAYGFENKDLHEGMPRQYPPDHHTHDEAGDNPVE
jgi:hypothetical protein